MNTRNKLAAALSTAVVGVGGVASHSAVFADDAIRTGGRTYEHIPPVHPAPPRPAAAVELSRTAEESPASKDVVCAAIGFLDDVAFDAEPTFEDFANWAWDEINQTPRAKAERIFDAALEVYEGDPSALSDIACEF
jgi:hypothetical protein